MKDSQKSRGGSASEATGLLANSSSAKSANDSSMPRSYSGEMLPLTSSYEDLRQSVEMQLQELNPTSMRKFDSVIPSGNILTRRHAICILIFGCASALSVYLISCLHQPSPHHPPGGHNNPNSLQPGVDPRPFSLLDPVKDLNLASFQRSEATAPPQGLFLSRQEDLGADSNHSHRPLPTNAWYQNLLLLRGEPSNLHRVYSSPYLMDVTSDIPGLRTQSTRVLASTDVLQLTSNEQFGLTMGAAKDFTRKHSSSADLSHAYSILRTTNLGLTLKWNAFNMAATIVKGMPYTTMEYSERSSRNKDEVLLPTISSPIDLAKAPIIDGSDKLDCSLEGATAFVDHELELQFFESDFTWLVFFSQPVWIQCKSWAGTTIQILEPEDETDDLGQPLIVRTALLNSCTTGRNGNTCKEGLGDRLPEENSVKEFANVLRKNSCFYPGKDGSVSLDVNDDSEYGNVVIDWDAQPMCTNDRQQEVLDSNSEGNSTNSEGGLIMFALPHHTDRLGSSMDPDGFHFCKSSLNGRTCLVQGSVWTLQEHLPRIGLQAPRLPYPGFVPALSEALEKDIEYSLPEFFERGAGDTYFSGKMLSKLGRILLIAEELNDICEGKVDVGELSGQYDFACSNITLPTAAQQESALDRLRRSVEVWINGTAQAPFVYDEAWGGVVNCGCNFNGDHCKNKFPDCPAFTDQGLNFGNGFYNDQHFHYGYHIHAAAVVAHFDSEWGQKHFEQVLLLVRNIANPSEADLSFPLFRHKDWYQGSSWASGVPLPPYLNGKNQESSSEAIAAYESVALYGQVMKKAWQDSNEFDKMVIADEVLKVGQMMAATEIRSAQKYWHIKRKTHPDEDVVPRVYTQNVVGILWSTMAQFGTWFGTSPYLPYGIQLLPLTPISEERDELDWVNEMYYPFSRACADFHQCTESGWAVLQLGILATVGYADAAAARVKELLPASYENAGGNGQSKSNTIWYIATRPNVTNPVEMDPSDVRGHEEIRPAPVFQLTDCHSPKTCTSDILSRQAGKYTCRERIDYMIHSMGNSQWEACSMVAAEFSSECGACLPGSTSSTNTTSGENTSKPEKSHAAECPACSLEQCESDLNRCPAYERSFVCTAGPSRGGCSGNPWILGHEHCHSCCEMTSCQKLKDEEAKKVTKDGDPLSPPKCPPCQPSICYGKLNQCPLHTAPYICLNGFSVGGCSSTPWNIGSSDGQCTECCEITVTC